jgi:hypothetical protein
MPAANSPLVIDLPRLRCSSCLLCKHYVGVVTVTCANVQGDLFYIHTPTEPEPIMTKEISQAAFDAFCALTLELSDAQLALAAAKTLTEKKAIKSKIATLISIRNQLLLVA